jgi:hypothetical protein
MDLAILALMVLSFSAIGATFVFYLAGPQRRETRRLERLPVQDAAIFAEAPVGSEMVVMGTLDRNESQHSSGLIGYALEHWDFDYDSEDGYQGQWETVKEVWPSLLVQTPSGWIRTAEVSSAQYGGDTHSLVARHPHSGARFGVIPEGVSRVIGYKNGAALTVVGHKSDAGLLAPTWFYGGTRDGLLKDQKQASWFMTGLGVFFTVASLLIVIASLGQFVLGGT